MGVCMFAWVCKCVCTQTHMRKLIHGTSIQELFRTKTICHFRNEKIQRSGNPFFTRTTAHTHARARAHTHARTQQSFRFGWGRGVIRWDEIMETDEKREGVRNRGIRDMWRGVMLSESNITFYRNIQVDACY